MNPNQYNKEEIDKYDIFDLLGLTSLEENKKKQLLHSMNELIWCDFLFTRLDKILSEKDLIEVKSMVDRSESLERILEFIHSKTPNFYELVLDYVRKVKIELISEHLDSDIEDIEESLNIVEDESKKVKLTEKLQKYTQAKGLLNESKWKNLKELMTS